jgi:hypothetical protein
MTLLRIGSASTCRLRSKGFELVGLETIEDLAADFLADACLQAAQGAALIEANHSRMKDSVVASVAAHSRQAIILSAASAEAYINEFIYRVVRQRDEEVDHDRDPGCDEANADCNQIR